jgi:hypothetical protein
MNTHRLTAMVMAVTLAGFTHALAAEENISTVAANDDFQQSAAEPKPEAENLMLEMELLTPTVTQASENLLTELKVYPSF